MIVDHAFVGVACFNPSEKLHGAVPVYGSWLDKGRVEGFKVEYTMNIHTTAPCGARGCGV